MSIEDYWRDDVIYYVNFTTEQGQKISKTLVLSVDYSLKEVENIIESKFSSVQSINHIDVWEDCLSLK